MTQQTTPPGQVTDESLRLLSLVERVLSQRLDEALEPHGSGVDQWRILSLLVERGGCPMSVVAEHVMLLAPTLSKLVDRMVSANLVIRRGDPRDRRRVLVHASARGREALAEWDAAIGGVRQAIVEIIGSEDAELLEGVLQRLAHGLGGEPSPAG